ncbi:MAG: hypothetical protein LUD15_06220 [Bacteroides sp.]|nr:hypothetical protein [Bacteroides sp.]
MKEIRELLYNYFEGYTDAAQKRRLRDYFLKGDIPEDLLIYKPLFVYLEEEVAAFRKQEKPAVVKSKTFPLLTYISGVAAALLLILGIGSLLRQDDPCLCTGSYVMIDGKCYTDPSVIRSMAVEALEQVSSPLEEEFSGETERYDGSNIVKEQLSEFGALFNED